MMASKKTIHGWDIIEDGNDDRLRNLKVPGTTRSLKLRKDIGPYLIAFASEYHTQIAAIDKGTYDDWAWCPPRDGRASSQTSDHCGGVAIDLNATKEGSQSKSNVFWATKPNKALAMRRLLKKYDLLEWGGDYKRFFDPMHVTFKYGVKAADVKAAMKRMAIDSNGVIK